jgi:hypothetical protein
LAIRVDCRTIAFAVQIARPWKAVALLAVGAAGGGTAAAIASVPDSNGVIHACYEAPSGSTVPATTTGNLRIIDPSAGQTCTTYPASGLTEVSIQWNQQGPQGIPGSQGPQGSQGPTGPQGAAAKANTINFNLVPPLIKASTGPEATVVLRRKGNVALQFSFVSFAFGGKGSIGSIHGIKFNEITIVRKYDGSPTIAKAIVGGAHYDTGTIFSKKLHGKQLRIDLKTVSVSSYGLGKGGAGDGVPVETITLTFNSETTSS